MSKQTRELAYQSGWQAWLNRVDRRANPYPRYGSHGCEPLAAAWMFGFTDSMDYESGCREDLRERVESQIQN